MDGFGIYTDMDHWSLLGVLNFKNLYLYWLLVTAAVFFLLSNKCYIFKCFVISAVFLLVCIQYSSVLPSFR